ncbi:MAG: hypothetical protein R2867_16785 [Caldilineaceae bacterium]
MAVTDAQVLAKHTQGVLLVINTEKTPRAMVAQVEALNAPMRGS